MSTAEDFWDDCRYEPRIEDSELTCKFKITYNLLSTNKPSSNKSKGQTALAHCHKMFFKAQDKSIKKHQTRNPITIEDLTECTWKPKITETQYYNNNNRKLKRNNTQTIYQRGLTHLHNHFQEINLKKLETENLITSIPFKPIVNYNRHSLSKVLGSNYRLDQNDSLNVFLLRYKKARKKSEERKTFFETDIILQSKKDSRKIGRASPSLSTKESCYIKRSLHAELFSIGGDALQK